MKKILLKLMLIVTVVCSTTINPVIWLDKAVADTERYFILCNPKTVLNARLSPSKHGSLVGYFMCGDSVTIDGRQKNGFLHCPELFFEANEGWIAKGYLVEDEPVIEQTLATVVASGRVACRNKVGGRRIRWLKPGTMVTVYAYSEEWCVTNRGYIRTEYLEINTTTNDSQ